jgi:hypothetical protein
MKVFENLREWKFDMHGWLYHTQAYSSIYLFIPEFQIVEMAQMSFETTTRPQ